MSSTIFFSGKDRNVEAKVDLDDGRTMFVLSVPNDSIAYPTLAVTGYQFKESGLYTGLSGWHRVASVDRFVNKNLPVLYEAGVYD